MKRRHSEISEERDHKEPQQKRAKREYIKWQAPTVYRDMPMAIATQIREFHMMKMFVSQRPLDKPDAKHVSFT